MPTFQYCSLKRGCRNPDHRPIVTSLFVVCLNVRQMVINAADLLNIILTCMYTAINNEKRG